MPKMIRTNDLHWINEHQISLMICNRVYFNQQQQKFMDEDLENIFEHTMSGTIDLSKYEERKKINLRE